MAWQRLQRYLNHLATLLHNTFCPIFALGNFAAYLRIISNPNSAIHQYIYYSNLLLYLKALHCVYLSVFPTTTNTARYLHYDGAEFFFPNCNLNAIVPLVAFATVYYNKALFVTVDRRLMALLRDVLLNKQWTGFFLMGTFRGKSICRLLRQLYKSIYYVCDVFRGIFVVGFLAINLELLKHLPRLFQFDEHPLVALLRCFYCLLSFLTFWCFVCNCLFDLSLVFTTLFVLLAAFYIKLCHIYDRLLSRLQAHYHTHFHLFQLHFHHTLSFFFAINRMYAWIFVWCLFFAVPEHILISVQLFFGHLPSPISQLVAGISVCYLFIFIFVLHLALAYPSKHILHFARPLIHLFVHHRHRHKINRIGHFRDSLKLSILIATFHVRNRYGFNYGNCGLVSMESFIKYILLYCKLMMLIYRLQVYNKN